MLRSKSIYYVAYIIEIGQRL